MTIEPLVLGALATVTMVAVAVAWLATLRARAAHARLRAIEGEARTAAERHGRHEPDGVGVAAVARSDPPRAFAPDGDAPPKVRVLVVEDEPGVREFITRVLMRAGREVVTAVGPQAALIALNTRPAGTLMLVDIVMPERDGYDFVVQARKVAPTIRVVFMSAFARDAVRHPGGDGFLSKPFTTESLLTIVDEALAF